MPVPILAAKSGVDASKRVAEALKNDIYVVSWSSVKGKGKKKRVVEHELHVNPVAVGVGVAVGWKGGTSRITLSDSMSGESIRNTFD